MADKLQPNRIDSKAKRMRKRLTERQKLAILHYYDKSLATGKNRHDLLCKFAEEIGVSSERQVERILAQAAKYEQELEAHFSELSGIALSIADNLSKIRRCLAHIQLNSPIIGELVYHGVFFEIDSEQETKLQQIDKNKATKLFSHIQKEFSELENINCWDSLAYKDITDSLILRLNQKGYKSNFKGKCTSCPR
jgi:hypothetical protein